MENNTDLSIFYAEQEDTGWARQVVFHFRGKRGKMLLAFEGYTGYTNCEILEAPVFDNESDAEDWESFWDKTEAYQWDTMSHNFIKEG